MALKLFRCFLVFALFACSLSFTLSAYKLLSHGTDLIFFANRLLPKEETEEISRVILATVISAAMVYGYGSILPFHKLIYQALTERNRTK